MSISLGKGRRSRAAKVILAVALVSLLVVSVYEVANYGHEVKWKFAPGQVLDLDDYHSPQVVDDRVYVYHARGGGEGVYVLGLDGKEQWSLDNLVSRPTVAPNGTMYVGATLAGDDHPSFCAFAPNGDLVWSYPVANGSFDNTLMGPEGNVYATNLPWDGNKSYQSELLAFSPDGHLLWNMPTEFGQPFSVSGNGTLLAQMSDRNLTGLSPNGSVLWNVPLTGTVPTPYLYGAVLGGETIYVFENSVGTEGAKADLCAVALNGSFLWRYPGYLANTTNGEEMGCLEKPVVDANGNVLFLRYNKTTSEQYRSLISVSPEGNLRWEYRDSIMGGLAVHDDTIVLCTDLGLTALDLSGHVKWRSGEQLIASYTPAPAIGIDGTVYAAVNDGIVAIGTNPIVLEVGLVLLVPVIAACLFVLWSGRRQ